MQEGSGTFNDSTLLASIIIIAFILVSSDYLNLIREREANIVETKEAPKDQQPSSLRSYSSKEGNYYSSSKINVFYNLYIANEHEEERVKGIIAEQLSSLIPGVHNNAWITSIGHQPSDDDITNAKVVKHLSEGDEGETLHAMWQYCLDNPHHDTKVVYLHSKGSFHDSDKNTHLRRFITKSALSQECADLPDQCDVCSSRMSPLPHPHVSGNMWLARCDYIAKLVNPLFKREGKYEKYAWNNSDKGYGRFFYEHWIHMHPTVRPCDVYPDAAFTYGYDNIPEGEFERNVQMAPRFDFYTFTPRKFAPEAKEPYLETMLSEFALFYNRRPDKSSWWGWNFFSDHDDESSLLLSPSLNKLRSQPSKINVFYNLYIANEHEEERVKGIIAEQLSSLIPGVHNNAWITSIGHQPSDDDITNAKVVKHLSEGDEGETLHAMWQYCLDNPHHDTKVVYLHSKGSFHDSDKNTHLRRFITKSALSQECADLPDQCDVCSSRMSPLPHPHVSGNMWLARCDYIAKLVNPLFKREGKYEKYAWNNSDKGYGRFFYEHWIHMHPTVRPCDVYPDAAFTYGYDNIPEGEFERNVQMAPRFDFYTFTPRKFAPEAKEPYLETMLSEFALFYNRRPDKSSWWGWNFFSD